MLHDGVVELSDRNNMPTAQLKGMHFGNKIAILGGDFLLASACTALSRLHHPKVVEIMSEAISAAVEGASHRTDRAVRERCNESFIGIKDWLKVAELTTGVVMANSCRAAALIGGHDTQVISAASEFGRLFGLAYQIKCEIDSFSRSFRENDLLTNLQSAPVVFAADAAPSGTFDFIRDCITAGSMTPEDELKLLELVERHNGVELALEECEDYTWGASKSLQGYRGCQSSPGWEGVPDSDAHTLLSELLEHFPLEAKPRICS